MNARSPAEELAPLANDVCEHQSRVQIRLLPLVRYQTVIYLLQNKIYAVKLIQNYWHIALKCLKRIQFFEELN